MQTLSVIFLRQEMPEIQKVVSTMDDVEILTETNIPNSELVQVHFLFSDPSILFTIGLLVGIDRARKMSDNIFKK